MVLQIVWCVYGFICRHLIPKADQLPELLRTMTLVPRRSVGVCSNLYRSNFGVMLPTVVFRLFFSSDSKSVHLDTIYSFVLRNVINAFTHYIISLSVLLEPESCQHSLCALCVIFAFSSIRALFANNRVLSGFKPCGKTFVTLTISRQWVVLY